MNHIRNIHNPIPNLFNFILHTISISYQFNPNMLVLSSQTIFHWKYIQLINFHRFNYLSTDPSHDLSTSIISIYQCHNDIFSYDMIYHIHLRSVPLIKSHSQRFKKRFFSILKQRILVKLSWNILIDKTHNMNLNKQPLPQPTKNMIYSCLNYRSINYIQIYR